MSDKKTNPMLRKTLTAIILIAIVLPPFFLGGWAMEALLLVVSFFASWEVASLGKEKPTKVMIPIFLIAIEVLAHMPVDMYAATSAMYLILLLIIEVMWEKFTVEDAVYSYVITNIVILAWQGVMRIYGLGLDGIGMLYVAIACYLCDTGAYFFGVFLGKHKMNPRISPNKTWEGAIGGYLCGLVGSLVYGLYLVKGLPQPVIYTASFILPAMAEIGDLAFSSIKRQFKIKDFGYLLPGHGGVLDRIDSLVFCLMIFNGILILFGF